jgi:hypothetical protein
MLDTHLAELYEVPTFRLNEAVKRNSNRFPEDFMFQLTAEEAQSLTSQFAMSLRQEKPVRSEAKEECRKRTRAEAILFMSATSCASRVKLRPVGHQKSMCEEWTTRKMGRLTGAAGGSVETNRNVGSRFRSKARALASR